jgi:hypothetical protein
VALIMLMYLVLGRSMDAMAMIMTIPSSSLVIVHPLRSHLSGHHVMTVSGADPSACKQERIRIKRGAG